MNSRTRIILLVLLIVIAVQLLPVPEFLRPTTVVPTGRVVTFVGNSLTSNYDIPSIVEQFTNSPECKKGPIRAVRILPGGVWLKKHYLELDTLKQLKQSNPAIVVIQEQSDVTNRFSNYRQEYTTKFVSEARALGAQPIVYDIDVGWWSDQDRSRINAEDEKFAAEHHASRVNAISIFKHARQVRPDLSPFGLDNHHLSRWGATLIAYGIAGVICGNQMQPFPAKLEEVSHYIYELYLPSGISLSEDQRRLLTSCERGQPWGWCAVSE